jgi:GLPGLI family protein
MKKALLILFAAVAFTSVIAQKTFEGTIEYKTTYKNLPTEMQGMEAMMPQGNTIYVSGKKSRMDQDVGMGANMVVIADSKTKENMIFVDAGMKKIKTSIPKDKVEEAEAENKNVKINYFDDETIDILGYTAKKAVISNGTTDIIVYYTDKLPSIAANQQFESLKGFPLYYEIEAQGMTIITQAEKIDKNVDKSVFEPLEGYEEMPYEQFEQMFQQGGGM